MKSLLFKHPRIAAVVLLTALGLAKLPLEQRYAATLEAQQLVTAPPALSLRDSMGQMSFAAILGGLRSLVASITFLQVYGAFENVDWSRVENLSSLTTSLQPRESTYWDDASWQMAYNAASFYQRNEKLRAAIRSKLYHDSVQRGIQFAEDGLKYLPEDARLMIRLGNIYSSTSVAIGRKPDPRLASEYYLKAHEYGAPHFYERFGAYELVKCNDRPSWERAYEILRRYYDQGPKFNTMASILRDLPVLEDRLNIPPEKRIHPPSRLPSPLLPPTSLPSKP